MVPENTEMSAEADPSLENAPASDSDPYSSSDAAGASIHYTIDTSQLPRPLFYNRSRFDRAFTEICQQKLQSYSKIIGRRLTLEEVNAEAFWAARQLQITSYGGPVGIAYALWKVNSSRSTFQYPFFKPDLEEFKPGASIPKFTPHSIRGNKWTIPLLHSTRLGAYGLFSGLFAYVFFAGYATSIATVGEYHDPRLQDIIKTVMRKAQLMRNPHSIQNDTEADSTAGGSTSEYNGESSEQIKSIPKYQGGAFEQSAQKQTSSRQHQIPREDYEDLAQSDNPSFNLGLGERDDIASVPPAPLPTPKQMQGSAWDRVRSGAMASPDKQETRPREHSGSAWLRLQNNSGRKDDTSSAQDNLSFSKSEEQSLAKEEAQKDFDAMVDRERRGEEFRSEDGERRW
ncbi:hypothetical protein B0O99DRAFT_614188 [Bisporella sp. PMI_857]|nr:hypothetical protein B0O99DRAFT_614188 [Bisporella sp. PMI_857]